MKTVKFILASAFSILFATTAVADDIVTKNISVADFTGISASTGIKVTYTTGPKKVVLEASEEIADRVSVKNTDGILKASIDTHGINNFNIGGEKGYKVTLKVSSPDAYKFEVSSGANITIPGSIRRTELEFEGISGGSFNVPSANADEIELEISSGASFYGESAVCNELDIEITSGATINLSGISSKKVECDATSGCQAKLSGTTDYASYSATSAANINARNLEAKDVEASATSVASIKCYASESIDARQSNQGSIGYAGHPKHVTGSRNPIYKMD